MTVDWYLIELDCSRRPVGRGDVHGEDARAPCVLPKLFGARCTIDFSHPMRKILRGGAGGLAERGGGGGARCAGERVCGCAGVWGGRAECSGAVQRAPPSAVAVVGQTVGRRRHCESVTKALRARSPHRDM